tara:strand:+ start:2187 stop:2984 length:798 start_codon:yes stop_codon:yes gene_type:complete
MKTTPSAYLIQISTLAAVLLLPLAQATGCATWFSKKNDESISSANGEGLPGVYYEVQSGDTLWAISKQYQVPVDELLEVNGLAQAQGLAIGQTLFIPTPLEHAPQAPKVTRATRKKPTGSATSSKTSMEALKAVGGQSMGWPLGQSGGVLYRTFRSNRDNPYEGISLGAPEGTAVLAVLDGEVKYVGEEPTAFGKMLLIKHADKHITVYAHMKDIEVKPGMRVKKGKQIGTLGQTGRTESPQLFFQIRHDRRAKNPLEYLSLEDE